MILEDSLYFTKRFFSYFSIFRTLFSCYKYRCGHWAA